MHLIQRTMLIFGFVVLFTYAVLGRRSIDPPEKCQRTWKKRGCYHDRIIPNRPFPEQLVNHRDVHSKVYDGHILNWRKWPQSIHALACRCAELTKEKGYRFFGLQFYGECWSGPSHFFARDGKTPNKCFGIDYKPCDDNSDTECVGGTFTNYIYDIGIDDSTPVKGGWTEWSEWSPCDRKCGGGKRVRERACSNPKPANGGSDCVGDLEEDGSCNADPCKPVCKNTLEIGIIADASTSVTRRNYDKMKEFVEKLTGEFQVGNDGVHFGMLHYAWDVFLDFTMNQKEFWNPDALKNKIRNVRYPYGGTRTDLALYAADKNFFCTGCVRSGVPKILIVMTDGRSSSRSDPMTLATKGLKAKGVKIISIGIGNKIDKGELLEIASDKQHVLLIEDFQYLTDRLNDILKVTCESKLG